MDWLRLILNTLVDLAWPALAFFLLLRFSPEIRSLLSRLKSAALPGGVSFELYEKAQEEHGKRVEAATKTAKVARPAHTGPARSDIDFDFDVIERDIIDLAAHSPVSVMIRPSQSMREVLRKYLPVFGIYDTSILSIAFTADLLRQTEPRLNALVDLIVTYDRWAETLIGSPYTDDNQMRGWIYTNYVLPRYVYDVLM